MTVKEENRKQAMDNLTIMQQKPLNHGLKAFTKTPNMYWNDKDKYMDGRTLKWKYLNF